MPEMQTVYHVVPNTNGTHWIIIMENSAAFRQEHRTKDHAVNAAEELAREQEPSKIKVHNHDEDMEYERAYGAALRRPCHWLAR